MSLKQEFLSKVPLHLKSEPHFATILEYIRKHNIQTKEHLADFLHKEIALVERYLQQQKHHGPTAVKSMRDKAVHLSVLKKCLEMTQEFIL